MVLKHVTIALSLAAVALSTVNGALASDQELIALNAPVRTVSDPALTQAVEILNKSQSSRSGQGKQNTIYNIQPANDATVVKHRKDLDKVLILGGAEVLPM